MSDATAGSEGEFDLLDLTILTQLANGKRTILDLGGAVNVRPNDLAMHLYKLGQQQYLSYEFRNGTITIALTEKGFLQAKSGMPKSAETQAPAAQGQAQGQAPQQQAQPNALGQEAGVAPAAIPVGAPTPTVDINQLEENIRKAKKKRLYYIVVLAAILIIMIVALMLKAK